MSRIMGIFHPASARRNICIPDRESSPQWGAEELLVYHKCPQHRGMPGSNRERPQVSGSLPVDYFEIFLGPLKLRNIRSGWPDIGYNEWLNQGKENCIGYRSARWCLHEKC